HRTDGSSPGFESLLYGYIAALAELAKTEFMAEFVAGSEELSDEAKRSIRQLFDQAGEIATRAKANQRAAQAKLLREAPSHEHLTLAAYSVAEVGDCGLAGELWERAGSPPADSPDEDYENQRALFRFAGLELSEKKYRDPVVKRAQRLARNALSSTDTNTRRYYHGSALHEAGCDSDAEAVWEKMAREDLQVLVRAQQSPLGSSAALEELRRVNRTTLDSELRRELSRLKLMGLGAAWTWWMGLLSEDDRPKHRLRAMGEELLLDFQDYGGMGSDTQAILAAMVRALGTAEAPLNSPEFVEVVLRETAELRKRFPDSTRVWGATFAAVAFGVSLEMPGDVLFASLAAGARPRTPETLYDYATLLARLQPERALETFATWPRDEFKTNDPLLAFSSVLVLMLGGDIEWSELLPGLQYGDVPGDAAANNVLVAAARAEKCDQVAASINSVEAPSAVYRLNAFAALTVCDGSDDPTTHVARFNSLKDEVEN
ncbi:MAG: hypothetical protein AAFY60_14465, partial [Myxococcota bacterium]